MTDPLDFVPSPYEEKFVPVPSPHVSGRYLQGGGGGWGGGSPSWGGGGGYYRPTRPTYGRHHSGGGCTGACAWAVASVLGFFFVFLVCYHCAKSKESKSNQDISTVPDENDFLAGRCSVFGVPTEVTESPSSPQASHFPPGRYTGTYRQYGRTSSMEPFNLRFELEDRPDRFSVRGEGSDLIGDYYLTGNWEGDRLALTKHYKVGTGDSHENKGHKVYIRLERDGDVMKGQYYVRTAQFSGSDEWKIWPMDGFPPKAAIKAEVEAIPTAYAVAAPVSDAKTDGESAKSSPSAPPLEGEEEIDIGPGIYARPTGFTAQAIGYHSDRLLVAPFRNALSSRQSVGRDVELDVTVAKTEEKQDFGVELQGQGTEPVITGLTDTGGVLAEKVKVGDKIVSINGETVTGGKLDALARLHDARVGNVVLTLVRKDFSQ